MKEQFSRQLGAEFIGTAFLLATVVGSGIMAEALAGGNVAICPAWQHHSHRGDLGCADHHARTGIGGAFQSGSHHGLYGPRRSIAGTGRGYIVVQVLGGLVGVWAAHLIFDLDVLQTSQKVRNGSSQWFAETVATFGLVFTTLATLKANCHLP